MENDKVDRNSPVDSSPGLLDESKEKKSLFYRRVESSACLQHAFKNSILLGIGASLLVFLKTTNVLKATYWAWGTYFVSQYPLWLLCRYNEQKVEEQTRKQEEMIFGRTMFEGTKYEEELDRLIEQKEKDGALNEVSNKKTSDSNNVNTTSEGGV